MTTSKQCVTCKKVYLIEMTNDQYARFYANQEHVQNIFPELSADMRELLISGMCGVCFDKMFEEDD